MPRKTPFQTITANDLRTKWKTIMSRIQTDGQEYILTVNSVPACQLSPLTDAAKQHAAKSE